MPTFITLSNFTDQGAKTIKDTVKRSEAVRDLAKKHGVTIRDIHWTMGAFDIVGVFEAPDEAAMSSFILTVAAAGNLRGQTLRAHNKDEMSAILAKVG